MRPGAYNSADKPVLRATGRQKEMQVGRRKITVIGAGNVGATCALWAAVRGLGDIVLIDVVEGLAAGKALDLTHAAPIAGFEVTITGTTDYAETASSDIAIITAGLARRPGMSRDDLLEKNARIADAVTRSFIAGSPDAVIIVVSNPMDAIVYVVHRASGLPTSRVVGMAGVLDSARMSAFVALEAGARPGEVDSQVLGGHGDSMVPLPRLSKVGDRPLTEVLSAQTIDAIVERTRAAGAEIVGLLKTGSAFYAPAAGAVQMAEAILTDSGRVLPCGAYCDREYGVGGLFVGVPTRLGAGGVKEVIEIELADDERAAFEKSVAHVRGLVEQVKSLDIG